MSLRRFIDELRRRRVIRQAVVYVIVAWIVIQAADAIFPALNIPQWAFSFVVVIAILGFPIALVLAWGFDLTRSGVVRTTGAAAKQDMATAAPEHMVAEKSIAVLPFVNMSDDKDNEYFSDGITEEILNALTKMQDLQVVARSSAFAFKGKDIDIRKVGQKLGVANVLEGSVRKAGSRLRITSQLINVANGYHLWSEAYDRELADVFEIQNEIASAIVSALKVKLMKGDAVPLVTGNTTSLEAYTLYLKGRFVERRFTERDAHLSLELYRQALEHDPRFADAYTGIADAWMQLADDWVSPQEAYPKAKEAALRALELNPTLAEAHTALGKVLGWFEWDFDGAELALRRALGASPRHADAQWGLASVLPTTGRLREAIRILREALVIDPLSATMARWLARYQLYARNYDQAIANARKALELDPYHTPAYGVIGSALLAQGKNEDALRSYEDGAHIENLPFFDAFRARALAALARTSEAREVLQALDRMAETRYIRPEARAEAYTALGDYDRAFALLEQAYEAHTATLMYLHIDPAFDPLHADPRFEQLTRRIGLRA